MQVRACNGKIEVIPELPMSALRGICLGIDTNVPNDPEGDNGFDGFDPL